MLLLQNSLFSIDFLDSIKTNLIKLKNYELFYLFFLRNTLLCIYIFLVHKLWLIINIVVYYYHDSNSSISSGSTIMKWSNTFHQNFYFGGLLWRPLSFCLYRIWR